MAVDMWSAGIILFVLVTGYSPFTAETDAELFEQIRIGAYEVGDPMWEKVSDGAKHLVVSPFFANVFCLFCCCIIVPPLLGVESTNAVFLLREACSVWIRQNV